MDPSAFGDVSWSHFYLLIWIGEVADEDILFLVFSAEVLDGISFLKALPTWVGSQN